MSIESRTRRYGKVFDHFQIGEFLGSGSGGKSAVFKLGRIDSTRGKSALKVINLIEEKGSINSLSAYRRNEYEQAKHECKKSAEQEAFLMEEMQGNTNVVDYSDHTFVDWQDETGFGYDMLIRMELLEDLRGRLRNDHRYGEKEILKIGRDICTALVLCHNKGILHRDIKPENIFINSDGNFKLGDFGVSRILSAVPSSMASSGVGTPEYAAPEQFIGRYDKRIDIYSLGLVLYELSNGNRLPFASTSYVRPMDVERRQMGEPLPPPSNASKAFTSVILKACAYRKEDRYQTAEEFLVALNKLSGIATPLPQRVTVGGRIQYRDVSVPNNNATQKATADNPRQTESYATVPANVRKNRESSSTVPDVKKKGAPKGVVIGIVLALLVSIGAAVAFGMNAAANREAIAGIIEEAQSLADAQKYGEAITAIQDGLEEYPKSDDLSEKLDEFSDLRTGFEISEIIATSEELASTDDFEGSIAKIESGLATYPDSVELQDKLTEYTNLLSAQIKVQTLGDAQALADAGEYETAMSIIKAAQEAYGENKEYDTAYNTYHKAYSLVEAEKYAVDGDYPNAIKLIKTAQTVNANDVDLIVAYNTYCDAYVTEILILADSYIAKWQIDDAIAIVDDGLRIIPNNAKLSEKKNEYDLLKPVSITSLQSINTSYAWKWNEGVPKDPFGNSYSNAHNYACFSFQGFDTNYVEYRVYKEYTTITGVIAPHADSGEKHTGYVQIYKDDVLCYTSDTIGRKSDAITFSVDVSGAEYIKIYVAGYHNTMNGGEYDLILSDVMLWP